MSKQQELTAGMVKTMLEEIDDNMPFSVALADSEGNLTSLPFDIDVLKATDPNTGKETNVFAVVGMQQ